MKDMVTQTTPRARSALGVFLGLSGLLLVPACGYHTAGGTTLKTPSAIHSLAIPTLTNKTTQQEVEQLLTRALIEQVSERTALRVSSQPSGSDAILQGEILSINAAPVIFGEESFASTFLVTIRVHIRITQQKDGQVLFENPAFIFRDQYVLNTRVRQFFSEQTPALRRMAKDFAESVITTFLNGF